jgi:NitT/TauT family transport system substrate-binding protein
VFALLAIVLVVVAFFSGWFAHSVFEPAGTAETVKFVTDWLPYPHDVAFHAGVLEGFYATQGVPVAVLDGSGSSDTCTKVSEGLAELGLADAIVALKSINEGMNIKIIGALYHSFGFGVRFIKGRGIETPQDLEGKNWGDAAGGASAILFEVYCEKAGLDFESINFTPMSYAVYYSALVEGTIDFCPGSPPGNGAVAVQLAEQGLELGFFSYGEYLSGYGHVFIVNADYMEENPNVVRNFMWATARSITWSIENPEEAVDHMMEARAGLDSEAFMEGWSQTIEFVLSDEYSVDDGQCYIHDSKMAETVDTVNEFWDTNLQTEDVYTNEFLEGMPNEWKFVS